ncbi:MAG: hypothetical protein AABY86_10375, partial [Bdellovibrionota bacterium]
MFANLLSIQKILRSQSDQLEAFLQLGLQHSERTFYEGPHGTVTYQELYRLTKECLNEKEGRYACLASHHPVHFFASFLKALTVEKCPLLFSHKNDVAYQTKLLSTIGTLSDITSESTNIIGVFTSGTGGTPKAVFHTLEGLLWNVLG